ncbi:unnamed protein product [Eruca vesicaria subsp. sativa]|uniref:Uncharacterized protein n=1 Tax=Eruca vesicaria subsp. sativa TaxID=29727 RepID=A0ABC8KNM1_ERUVS|nr:unnamed protein product [Eruca vesicaria subsp. sativa]
MEFPRYYMQRVTPVKKRIDTEATPKKLTYSMSLTKSSLFAHTTTTFNDPYPLSSRLVDLTGAFESRSGSVGPSEKQQETNNSETPKISGGFTLIELLPTQAVKLFYFTDYSSSSQAAADDLDISPLPRHSHGTLNSPSNSALLDRAPRFLVIANEQQQNGNVSGETTTTNSVPSTSTLIWIESKHNLIRIA